ncbi:MAG: ABC transporter substrate-binding protein [Candidatus Limivicinus sp.]|jgi:raffinose/stachyose/melibiose transport system substrate-binding protein
MKRKLIAMVLMAAMILTLAACGSGNTEEAPAAAEKPEEAQAVSQDTDEVVEIHLANWRTEEIEAFEEINAEFMKEYPNIHPVYDAIKNTEYDSKLSIDLTSGTAADIVYVRPFDRGYDLYKNGYLEALDRDKLPNMSNISDLQASVYTEDSTSTLFGAPFMYINYAFLYNKTLFDELGIEEPETWDEFFAACDTIKESGVTPLAFGIKDNWILSGSVSDGIFGNFVGGEEGRQKLISGELLPTSPEMVAQFETMNKFVDYMPENYEGVSYLDNVQMFAMGQAAIYPGGSFDVGFIESQGIDFEMGVFAPPVVNSGDTRWTSMNGGAGLGINAASEHKEEAYTYINWLLGEKGQIMIGNGAPGLFPCASNVDASKMEDPIIGEMMGFGGENGGDYTISWCMKLNGGNPTATALADENISLMLQGTQTAEEAAQKIQDGVSSWYEPWQGK